SLLIEYGSTRKHDIAHITRSFVVLAGTEDPLIAAPQHSARVIQIQQREPQPVKAPSRRNAHTVINDQPSIRRFNRRRRQTNLIGIPPRAAPCLDVHTVISPMLKVGRVRQPYVRLVPRKTADRTMQQCPASSES